MIDATILFADLRGYTALSQSLNPMRCACWTCFMTSAPAPFGKRTASSTDDWRRGDGRVRFPGLHGDHPTRALHAAREIQRRFADQRAPLDETFGLTGAPLGIGIGIDTGELSFGDFGQSI